ncbi:MAG TPA: hypothetical protein VN931_04425 [Fibrobacteria bacterium]|nr:hypothetical protein [Fibrobacteria bacterium]
MTSYHAKLWAYQLTLKWPPDATGKLAGTMAGARVKSLDGTRDAKRKPLFEAQDKVEKEQGDLLDSVERQNRVSSGDVQTKDHLAGAGNMIETELGTIGLVDHFADVGKLVVWHLPKFTNCKHSFKTTG